MSNKNAKANAAANVSDDNATITKLLPAKVSECALTTSAEVDGMCMTPAAAAKILRATNTATIEAAKKVKGCDTEKCVIEKSADILGPQLVRGELARFKMTGPTDTALLTNMNIDKTLDQWVEKFPNFYNYGFNMLDYAKHSFANGNVINRPDTLASVSFAELWQEGIKCAACVINTDVYAGRGKHWMALFIDCRDAVSSTPTPITSTPTTPTINEAEGPSIIRQSSNDQHTRPSSITPAINEAEGPRSVYKSSKERVAPLRTSTKATVEFFNSSGNPPALEWVNWLVKIENVLKSLGMNVRVVICSGVKHQFSRTECGVYSLFYIWARLNGVPADYFLKHPIKDEIMFEFRQHLFAGPHNVIGAAFDAEDYMSKVKTSWE